MYKLASYKKNILTIIATTYTVRIEKKTYRDRTETVGGRWKINAVNSYNKGGTEKGHR